MKRSFSRLSSNLVRTLVAPLAISSSTIIFHPANAAIPNPQGIFQTLDEAQQEETEAYEFLRRTAQEKPEMTYMGNGMYFGKGLTPLDHNDFSKGFTGTGICVENKGDSFAVGIIPFHKQRTEKIGNFNLEGKLLSISEESGTLTIINLLGGKGKVILYSEYDLQSDGRRTTYSVDMKTEEELERELREMPIVSERVCKQEEIRRYRTLLHELKKHYIKK